MNKSFIKDSPVVEQDFKIPYYNLILKADDYCKALSLNHETKQVCLIVKRNSLAGVNLETLRAEGAIYLSSDDNYYIHLQLPDKVDSNLSLYYVAHEVGHLMQGHIDNAISDGEEPKIERIDLEIEADNWALQYFCDSEIDVTEDIIEKIKNNYEEQGSTNNNRNIVFKIKGWSGVKRMQDLQE